MKLLNPLLQLLFLYFFIPANAQVYEKVFSFTDARAIEAATIPNRGSTPRSALTKGNDGNFYGTTVNGGASGNGTVFRMTPSGDSATLVEFTGTTGSNKGSRPLAALVQGHDGNFYGTTEGGGAGLGTVFKMTPGGTLTTLVEFSFTNGSYPEAALIQGSDGNFYGTTKHGGLLTPEYLQFPGENPGSGTVFTMTPEGQLTTLVKFRASGGAGNFPRAALYQGSDGNFYGTTSGYPIDPNFGLFFDAGTVFKMTPSGVLTTLVKFSGNGPPNMGSFPTAALVQGNDGNFYGTTSGSRQIGAVGLGTVFRMTPSGNLTTLHDFTSSAANLLGGFPNAALLKGNDGNFYGTTSGRNSSVFINFGTMFKITPSGVFTNLVNFTGNGTSNKGSVPYAGLVIGSDGNFYGTTQKGGKRDIGTVFKVTPSGDLTTLVEFSAGSYGIDPLALLQGSDGDFYGTTESGGSNGFGSVFKMTAGGVLTTLVDFTGNGTSNKGATPSASLVQGSDGALYGTTKSGGANSRGTVFKMTRSGLLTTLIEFTNNGATNKGASPSASLAQGSDGALYGTTTAGGANNNGTVFKMTENGLLTTLVEFTNNGASNKGRTPSAALVLGSDGNFYGTTTAGGANDYGTVFKMTENGMLTTLVEFTDNGASNKGKSPTAALIQGSDGALYGTTSSGGAHGFGTIFKMTGIGLLTTLVEFTNNGTSNKGRSPLAALVQGSDGVFYGTTQFGGANGFGTVFKVTAQGSLTTLMEFTLPDAYPITPLIQATDGTLYGTVSGSDGAIFRLIFPGAPLIFQSNAKVLSTSSALIQGNINARGSLTSVWLEYGTEEAALPNMVSVATNLSGYQTKLVGTTLDSLEPGAIYYYRFRAVSSAGTTVSPIQSFSTLAAPLANATAATLILPTSAQFNGIVNARNFDTTVTFEWGTDGNSFPNTVDANPASVSGNSDSPVFISVAGLTEGTTYYYRISATNAGGTTVTGVRSFRTLIPATASIPGVTALSTTRAQVTGIIDAEGSSANVSFEYGTDGINFPNSFSASPVSVSGDLETQVTATLTGLTQGTTYHVRIRAQGPGGTGLSPVSTFSLSILSGLVQVFPDPPPASGGSVTVNFSPANVGAWRFAGDTKWINSGVPSGNLAAGQRVIEFIPIPGFIRPPSETVDVSGSANLILDRLYFETPSAGSGSLTVRLKPDEIAAPGVPLAQRAQWRVVGESIWRNSGDTPNGLVAGSYLVECKPVAGRETPPTIAVSIADADSQDLTLTYFTANSSGGLPPLPQTYADVSANEDMPFAHVGQIRSEVGSSTGFVVKRRVVATAGHVVFDDGTLSAVTGMRWFFQRHRGQNEPRPQVPRGSYLAAGYDAQRILDNSPGEGSAQSQDLDYAAIYFTEEAGRGGYGGYLASDSGDDNEFLDSTSEKILAGFPTSGIPETDSGKLHATTSFTSPLSAAFGETWTTTAARGLGGMSGGPLFVRHQSGTYFPAAIYLGGAGQTVVRAIDSDVVELFLRAEVSGNGGDNNTDGGITHTSVAGNLNVTQAGSLRVNIEPAGANAVGAAWQLNPETTLRSGGSQRSGLSPGTYSLKFKTIAGFQPPANQTVNVTGGQLTTITFTYQEATSTPLETWRQTHFGTTSNTGDAADNNDFDKDGETNIEEFTAGTNPISATDVFKMTTTTKSGNSFTTTVPGKSGRTYTLLRNTTLSGEWTRLESQGPLTGDATVTLEDPSAPADKSFYIIEVTFP